MNFSSSELRLGDRAKNSETPFGNFRLEYPDWFYMLMHTLNVRQKVQKYNTGLRANHIRYGALSKSSLLQSRAHYIDVCSMNYLLTHTIVNLKPDPTPLPNPFRSPSTCSPSATPPSPQKLNKRISHLPPARIHKKKPKKKSKKTSRIKTTSRQKVMVCSQNKTQSSHHIITSSKDIKDSPN
ncbi:hypothetical protein BDZ91DRAFT_156815 [Kalaharituber pfeilii]|nr:hypothetical protein BDZ91DRAFT_156815 [Kalaharituber pfeilii]